jgi:C-terminal processing protease CtpA/Prc
VEYRDGVISDNVKNGATLAPGTVHALHTPDPPVAVLIGPQTASSGEATALAFVGRPDTRLFGTTTAGYTTGNSTFVLFDGSALNLATVAMADRTDTTHMGGIAPDEAARTDWATYGSADDPAIQAATEWLEKQPACAAATPVAPSGS